MNGDPFRTSQPSDRRVINRAGTGGSAPPVNSSQSIAQSQAASYRPVDELPPVTPLDEPRRATRLTSPPARHSGGSGEGRSARAAKGSLFTVLLVFLALVIGGFGGYLFPKASTTGASIEKDKYQAVYLMNGQLYFGKLSVIDDQHLKLSSVYYLQADAETADEDKKASEQTTTAASNFKLVKLSGAIYGPSDEMVISKDQVLYYQNLNADSKATQLIENDK